MHSDACMEPEGLPNRRFRGPELKRPFDWERGGRSIVCGGEGGDVWEGVRLI
jgi:hypothetical protein